MTKLSVITCTHNPGPCLDSVLLALRNQTLARPEWEYLLVDNASERRVSEVVDLSWHPQARHVREERLGLTAARLRGIAEASSPILVFVDDDNVLAPDFAEQVLRVGELHRTLGAWSGNVEPLFEEPSPRGIEPFLPFLAVRAYAREVWSNDPTITINTLCGAGLCVRAEVAREYSRLVSQDSRRAALDRIGNLLSSCGDTDLALTACDVGLGTGLFPQLRLQHVLPARRLELGYLKRLVESISYSFVLLKALRGLPQRPPSRRQKLYRYLQTLWIDSSARHCRWAWMRGEAQAFRDLPRMVGSV